LAKARHILHNFIIMADDTDPPAPLQNQRRKGRKPGQPNYQNSKLIPIIERILPNGSDAWRLVAIAYKEESGEDSLRTEDDLRRNWVRKLCNNFKKPTGATGENGDRIQRCIEIERRIQGKTSSGILGASSGEEEFLEVSSSEQGGFLSCDDGSVAAAADNTEAGTVNVDDNVLGGGSDELVDGVIDAQDSEGVNPTSATKPSKTIDVTPPQRFPIKRLGSSSSKSGKTKNSSNKSRGSVLKTIDRKEM